MTGNKVYSTGVEETNANTPGWLVNNDDSLENTVGLLVNMWGFLRQGTVKSANNSEMSASIVATTVSILEKMVNKLEMSENMTDSMENRQDRLVYNLVMMVNN